MEDFTLCSILGLCFGIFIAFLIVGLLNAAEEPKVKTSGSYLTYENVIYKQVNQEELDNIIVLEVK